MKRKSFTLLMLLGSCIAAGTHASECSDQGFYVGGFAGANTAQQKEIKSPGFAGGGSVGYKFNNNIRVEGEAAYRTNKVKNFHARASTSSVMGNVYYDFENESDWTPYVGAGIGYGRIAVSQKFDGEKLSIGKSRLAYQGMAGVDYKIADKTRVGLEYKFFTMSKLSNNNHTIALTLKRYF